MGESPRSKARGGQTAGRLRAETHGRSVMSSTGAPDYPPRPAATRCKTKKKTFVQQKVELLRASDPVRSVLMWGVNHSISDLSQVPVPVMLLPDDFRASTKTKVCNHLFNKENLPGQFKFKEYCPQVFRNLRERFGIDDHDYQVSLAHSPLIKAEFGPLFMSYDRTLVVKEISSDEVEDMHNILSEYHQHVVTCHGSTLLPQFLAMYRVTVESEDTYLLVMRNMFSHRMNVHRKYDLKVKDLYIYKDVDRNNMQKVYICGEEKQRIMEKLQRDTQFLVGLRILDYSLLLGIHDVERAEREEEEMESPCEEKEEDESPVLPAPSATSSEGIAGYMNSFKPMGPGEFDPYVDVYAIQSSVGSPQREVYFMGLIDVLTQYDAKKKAAHTTKAVKHGPGADISIVHPEQYAKRFQEFVANIFEDPLQADV